MLIDHRSGKFLGGIEMQEYDPKLKRLVGQVHYLTEVPYLDVLKARTCWKKMDSFI